MLSAKNRIRAILGLIALVSWSATLLSLIAIDRMIDKINIIVSQDAEMVELGESINIGMLEARRDEKNFIIYSDSTYLVQNRIKIRSLILDIQSNRQSVGMYTQTLDSLEIMINHYVKAMHELSRTYKEDPKALYRLQAQVRDYEKELQALARKEQLNMQEFSSMGLDFTGPLLSAAMKISSDQVRLFSDLRGTSAHVQRLAQKISAQARDMLARDGLLSIQYGLRAQKWTFILLILMGLGLIVLIIVVPNQIFLRFQRLNRALKAMGRGETELSLPVVQTMDEVDELTGSFHEAIEHLKYFNHLKTEKIVDIERNLRKIIDEVDEAILILSPELKITHLNRSAQKLLKITTDVVHRPVRNLQIIWEQLGDDLEQIERRGRTEAQIKIHKRDLKKYSVIILPIMGITNRLDSVVVFIM